MRTKTTNSNLDVLICILIMCSVLISVCVQATDWITDFEEGYWKGANYVAHLAGDESYAWASLSYSNYSDLLIELDSYCWDAFWFTTHEYSSQSSPDSRYCLLQWYISNHFPITHTAYYSSNGSYFIRTLAITVW